MKRLFVLLLASTMAFGACKSKKKATENATAEKSKVAVMAESAKASQEPKAQVEEPAEELKSTGEHGTWGTTKDVKSYEPKIPDDLFFGMYRSPCFGQCPVYNIDIKMSGEALLEGKKFFDYEGFHVTKFSEESMQRIMALAEQYGYFSFDNVYDAGVTDVPSTLTILRTDASVHWVYDRMNAPEDLRKFETEVETIIKDQMWHRRDDKGQPE
jgi:hypothetical protein